MCFFLCCLGTKGTEYETSSVGQPVELVQVPDGRWLSEASPDEVLQVPAGKGKDTEGVQDVKGHRVAGLILHQACNGQQKWF